MNPDSNTNPNADPADETEAAQSIRHAQTVEIRHNADRNDYRITVTAAVKAAGLGRGATFQFNPAEFDDLGMIPALGAEADADAPRDRYTRTVSGSADEGWLELPLPPDVIAKFRTNSSEGIGKEGEDGGRNEGGDRGETKRTTETERRRLPLINLFAGDRLIALAPSEAVAIPLDALPDDSDRVASRPDERDRLRLNAIQTAKPRVKVGKEGTSRMAVVTITRAIRAAGLMTSPTRPFSVTYHPEAAPTLGGLIPVVGYQRSSSPHDPSYAVIRETGRSALDSAPGSDPASSSKLGTNHDRDRDSNETEVEAENQSDDEESAVCSIGLPSPVLSALGISIDELERLSRAERPAVTVYAGDGVLGLETPRSRTIAVDRE